MPSIEYTVMWNGQLRLLYSTKEVQRLKDRLSNQGITAIRVKERKLNVL